GLLPLSRLRLNPIR
ncbi:putative exonuclease VIII, ds DNA exonuclease encoded by prophage, partial [Escherichia coli 3.4870]